MVEKKLSLYASLVFHALQNCLFPKSVIAYASYTTLLHLTQIGSKSTLSKSLKELKQKGLVSESGRSCYQLWKEKKIYSSSVPFSTLSVPAKRAQKRTHPCAHARHEHALDLSLHTLEKDQKQDQEQQNKKDVVFFKNSKPYDQEQRLKEKKECLAKTFHVHETPSPKPMEETIPETLIHLVYENQHAQFKSIQKTTLAKFIQTYGEEKVKEKILMLRIQYSRKPESKIENPAGLLFSALREDYSLTEKQKKTLKEEQIRQEEREKTEKRLQAQQEELEKENQTKKQETEEGMIFFKNCGEREQALLVDLAKQQLQAQCELFLDPQRHRGALYEKMVESELLSMVKEKYKNGFLKYVQEERGSRGMGVSVIGS